MIQPFFEYLDHTADIQLHSSGNNFEEALIQIGYALINYMTELDKVECEEEIRIHVEGYDEFSLVYSFLDELLYQFAGEQFVSKEIQILDISSSRDLLLSHIPESHPLHNNNGITMTTTTTENEDTTTTSTNRITDSITFSSRDEVQKTPSIPTIDNNNDDKSHDKDNKKDKDDNGECDNNLPLNNKTYKIDALLKGERWNPEKHVPGTEIKAITYSNMQIHRIHDKTDIYVIVDI